MALVELGYVRWCSGCWYNHYFLTCNTSLDCFVLRFLNLDSTIDLRTCDSSLLDHYDPNCVFVEPNMATVIREATYFPPLVQQPDESTVAPLSNHVHASYRGTSLYRLTIDSGGRIVFCAVLPETHLYSCIETSLFSRYISQSITFSFRSISCEMCFTLITANFFGIFHGKH